jgi:NAD(P)-dependent dehydrogenase (short-subunit alcohol dehydrogenase family)
VSKPVLITGAFGQVGKRCTEILLLRGRTVVATDPRTDALAATVAELARGKHSGALRSYCEPSAENTSIGRTGVNITSGI